MLRILYLMEDTDLSGGVRIQLAQADALIERGHHVAIATRGLPLTWRRSAAEWIYVDDFRTIDATGFDFVIGTFWTTVEPAWRIAGERALHLCQGYEGSFTAYQEIRDAIDHVYGLPIPKVVVAPSLIPVVARFGAEVFDAGQIVDDGFYRDVPPDEEAPLRLLLVGASQVDFKGIDVGYDAALHARWHGAEFHLIRISPWAPGGDEPVEEHVHEFHVGLPAEEMRRVMHSCHLFLGPSRRQEGFGLPAAEAMASSIPVILSRIPSFLSFSQNEDFALWAEEGDGPGMGERLMELLDDSRLRRQLAVRGHRVAERFRAHHTAERLERWLLERRRRTEF